MISPAARDALEAFQTHLRALKGASDNTLRAYGRDLTDFIAFMTEHTGQSQGLAALARVTTRDMRSWMARTQSGDVGPRSMARQLSAVKSFYRWLAEREGFEPTAVLAARAPKFTRKLPRPLPVDAARDVLDLTTAQDERPWVGARDVAVLTLLWGCGLRISEALSLTGADAPLPNTLRIRGKGGKERVVPVIAAAREAVDSYLALCPHPLERDAPLFRGIRGGALNARMISGLMARVRMHWVCRLPRRPMRCVIPLQHICWRQEATCAVFRNFWVMPHFPRHKPIRRSMRAILWMSTGRPIQKAEKYFTPLCDNLTAHVTEPVQGCTQFNPEPRTEDPDETYQPFCQRRFRSERRPRRS